MKKFKTREKRQQMKRNLILKLIIPLTFLATGCAVEPQKIVPEPYVIGQTTYHNVCANCHGADAMGGKGAPTFLQEKFVPINYPNGRMVRAILNGSDSGAMPSQKGKVNDEEIKEIIKYIRHSQREAGVIS